MVTLLSTAKRKEYFKFLGLGEYNPTNILKLQKKYFVRKKDCDGEYGPDTDTLLYNLYVVTRYAPHFALTEFRCHCGGKYCTGYPARLSIQLLKNLEKMRTKFGGPINISSPLRCPEWNKRQTGSASNSRHTKGKAVDIYGPLTNTAAKRAKVKSYWYTLTGSNYCYFGTSNMGSSVHCDVK